jgi:hypothetical protein
MRGITSRADVGSVRVVGCSARWGPSGDVHGRQCFRSPGSGGIAHVGVGWGDSVRATVCPCSRWTVVRWRPLIGPCDTFEFKFDRLN